MAREITMMKEVWVPSDKPFVYKEQVDPRTGEHKYILKGLILPFNKVSRNNVLYNVESVKAKHKDLIGRCVMYNHKLEGQELPKGHFTGSSIVEEPDDEHPVAGWYYEADIDPAEKELIRKLERKDLRHVSIQLVGGKVVERMSEKGPYSEAYVQDIIEGSLVPAPGFLDTTAEFAEAFKAKLNEEVYKPMSGLTKLPGVKPTIRTADGDAEYIGTEVEDSEGRWNDSSYYTKDGYWVIHVGDKHHVYYKNPRRESADNPYDTPRYDGDCQICPFDGEDATKTPEELAEGFITELGEDAVKVILKEHYDVQ